MPGETAVPESTASPAEPERIRVLVPSRIGPIGVEFRHAAISRVVVAPRGPRIIANLTPAEEERAAQ